MKSSGTGQLRNVMRACMPLGEHAGNISIKLSPVICAIALMTGRFALNERCQLFHIYLGGSSKLLRTALEL